MFVVDGGISGRRHLVRRGRLLHSDEMRVVERMEGWETVWQATVEDPKVLTAHGPCRPGLPSRRSSLGRVAEVSRPMVMLLNDDHHLQR
jgi:hypothetical protein